jgi:Protein of unknown function (DUF3122)
MFYRIFKKIFWWLLLLGIVMMFLFASFGSLISGTAIDKAQAVTVIASVSHIEGSAGEIVYRSQQKLADKSGNTWHVILLKRSYPGQVTSISLRLMGCPGSPELIHPQALTITSTTGETWKATDIFLDEAPTPTIGQYDLKNILPELPTDNLLLSIHLVGEHWVNIPVPQFVVQEWQEVLNA